MIDVEKTAEETAGKKNIYESIAAVMKDIGAVGKDSRNAQQGFMFRGIDAVMNALSPALIKNKVFVVPEVLEQTREERKTEKKDQYGNMKTSTLIYSICKIKYTFYAEDGSSLSATVIGEGMDSGDKATNKAMSIAFKYACFQVFCIPTEEMVDPDAECHDVQPKAPEVDPNAKISAVHVKALVSKCKKEGVSEDKIKALYKVNDLSELTITKYANINEHWDKIKEYK